MLRVKTRQLFLAFVTGGGGRLRFPDPEQTSRWQYAWGLYLFAGVGMRFHCTEGHRVGMSGMH